MLSITADNPYCLSISLSVLAVTFKLDAVMYTLIDCQLDMDITTLTRCTVGTYIATVYYPVRVQSSSGLVYV